MQRVNERLVLRRHALNLSQDELAEKSGVSARAIAGYETGKSTPTPRILAKLATALGWEPGDFYAPPAAQREPSPAALRETPFSTEAELWKTRALSAEKKLAMVRDALRRIVEASADAPPLPEGDAERRQRAVQIGLDASERTEKESHKE